MGVPVLITAPEQTAIIVAAETVNAERFATFAAMGHAELHITAHRAQTLKIRAYGGDSAMIAVPKKANLAWLNALIDPAGDLNSPMKGPFDEIRSGPADLRSAGIALVKSAHLLPAVVSLITDDADTLAQTQGLTQITTEEIDDATKITAPLADVASGRVPTWAATQGRVHVFRPDDGGDEHYAIEIGKPDRNTPVLTRLHSACFTGDVLGSLKCDCGDQLKAAMHQMAEEGGGVLLYLNQEGRGIGLANKMRAYSLQDQGFDTVEANHRLGFEDDERDFRIGARLLDQLRIKTVRLLTNNPAKVARLGENGITVAERVPLKVKANPLNKAYLDVKAKKSGHIL
jgi:GTP cyclohydrolase II